MIIPKHNFDARPFATVALTLLLASFCYSQPKDVAGRETAHWGMSNQDLVAAFGTRLKELPKRMSFLNWHADYVMPCEIDGHSYNVFFQMAGAEMENLIAEIRGTNDGNQLPLQLLPSYFSLVSIRKGDRRVS